jgi:outer membrane murein-binding lipoprotein Lpp
MTETDLVSLKSKIDSLKQKQSELKGKKKALLETLQTNFGCKTIEEASKKATEIQVQIEQLDEQREEVIKEIQENYEL